jgi:hypothetical protein
MKKCAEHRLRGGTYVQALGNTWAIGREGIVDCLSAGSESDSGNEGDSREMHLDKKVIVQRTRAWEMECVAWVGMRFQD